ncbi:hypothetical protein AB5I41_22385 [Sphingomonas sp. MMS24-JH45]
MQAILIPTCPPAASSPFGSSEVENPFSDQCVSTSLDTNGEVAGIALGVARARHRPVLRPARHCRPDQGSRWLPGRALEPADRLWRGRRPARHGWSTTSNIRSSR